MTTRQKIVPSAVLLTFAAATVLGGCQSSNSADTGSSATPAAARGGTAAAPPGINAAAQRDMEATRAAQSKQANDNGMAMKKAMEAHGR